jgi:uncharacterized protein YjbI with pentapeptide repeats
MKDSGNNRSFATSWRPGRLSLLAATLFVLTTKLALCADVVDLGGLTFVAPVDTTYWKSNLAPGMKIEVDSNMGSRGQPKVRRLVVEDPISFRRSHFTKEVDFTDARFDFGVDFAAARFDTTAFFSFSGFYDDGVFNSCDFRSFVNFFASLFDSRPSFVSSKFHDATFKAARFYTGADFRYAMFHADVDFSAAIFFSSLSFRYAVFRGKVVMSGVLLPDSLDLRDFELSQEIDLATCVLRTRGKKCCIALYGTDLNKVKFSLETFQLWFPPDTIQAMRVGPSGKVMAPTPEQRLGFYEQLLSKFKSEGFLQSFEIADKEYQNYRASLGNVWDKFANSIDRIWWDHGYAKERVFAFSGMLWLLSSIVNLSFYRTLRDGVYEIPFLDKRAFVPNKKLGKLLGFVKVLTYTGFIFFGLRMDQAKFRPGAIRSHALAFVWVMMIYVTGLVCLGFVANTLFTM